MDKERILQEFPLAVKLIEAEEGFRATPYKCTAGAWTIGYGTNLDARHLPHEGLVWTRAQAEEETLDELDIIIAELDRRWPSWRKLNDARRAAVLSSVYQLGIYGAASFKNTIAKLLAEDFSGAADNLLASKWAKQTPQRVQRNADIIRSGILPQEVNGVQILPAPADPGMDQAQSKPAAPVLPAGGSGVATSGGAGTVHQVRENVPAAAGLTIRGVPISKKLTVAILAFLAVLLNTPLHLGMDYGMCKELVTLACSYVLGQAGVDAFGPVLAALIKKNGESNA